MSKKRAPRAKSERTERREVERAGVKLAEVRLKLALIEPGGTPERPIEVTSASVVEPHAAGLACAACGEATRVVDHTALTASGWRDVPRSIRVAHVRCTRCGVERDVYFRLTSTLPN